jgi:hypothetical protein
MVLVKGLVERGCMGYLEMNEFEFDGPKINMAAAYFQDGSFSEDQHTVETKAFKGKGAYLHERITPCTDFDK